MSSPSKRTFPLRAYIAPAIARIVVDLPAPLEPIKVTISFSLTVKLMPLHAATSP